MDTKEILETLRRRIDASSYGLLLDERETVIAAIGILQELSLANKKLDKIHKALGNLEDLKNSISGVNGSIDDVRSDVEAIRRNG